MGHACRQQYYIQSVCVHHERVGADDEVSKFWFVRSFSSQPHSKFIANIATENMSQVRTKECKTISFICEINRYCVLRDAITVIQLSL